VRPRTFRPSGGRLVDGLGLVGCPRRGADVPVATCRRCRALRHVVADDTGRVLEVHCLDGGDHRIPSGPWLVGWLAPRRG
jgi:hypothetical protein